MFSSLVRFRAVPARGRALGALSLFLLMAGAPPVQAQTGFPAASPLATVQQRIGLADFEVTYSRPSMRGREIFGGLVPYGEVWRTGANAATRLSLSADAKIGEVDVPAGTYALFTIPDENEWTIILSRQVDAWGAMSYNPAADVARIAADPVELSRPVETFTIGFDELRDDSATLFLEWEHVRVPIPIGLETTATVMAHIEEEMATAAERKPWHQAASFYLKHGKDLEQALAWATAAVENNPDAYWSMHLRARILLELGRAADAADAARRSLAVAREAGNPDYVRLNEDLLSTLP